MIRIDVVCRGELRCEATHGPSSATVFTDAPADNHGKGESFSPTDLVATELGACRLTIMGIVSQRHGIDLRGTKMTVEKHMITEPVRRFGRLPVRIEVPVVVSPEQRKLLEAAALKCPV